MGPGRYSNIRLISKNINLETCKFLLNSITGDDMMDQIYDHRTKDATELKAIFEDLAE